MVVFGNRKSRACVPIFILMATLNLLDYGEVNGQNKASKMAVVTDLVSLWKRGQHVQEATILLSFGDARSVGPWLKFKPRVTCLQ